MSVNANAGARRLRARVLSGSFVLLAGSCLVTGTSFAYNLVVARFLGPASFGHVTAIYTILILVSAVTLSFQIICAKMVAQHPLADLKLAAYQALHRYALASGILIAILLVLFRDWVANYLHLAGSGLVVWLAIGVAFYVPLGSRRGYLQGVCNFRRLAANMVLEGVCRLCGSLWLITLGLGVTGVIVAMSGAVVMAYWFALPPLPASSASSLRLPSAFREAMQAVVFFVGQVTINNCDIILVKHFFPSEFAGIYAAIALVGRVIFSFSWAIVHTMFPVVAGARAQDRQGHGVLRTALLMVAALGGLFTLALRLSPAWSWTTLFGSQFVMQGGYGLPYLSALYAAATTIYALSVVVIAYEMSYRIANTGWVQLAFSAVLIAGIQRFHSSLHQVIWVQIVIMASLLTVVAMPFLWSLRRGDDQPASPGSGRLQTLRRVSEDEVIAEFLRSDFYKPEFAEYQEALSRLVERPDLTDAYENLSRRALLFIRNSALWRQLPEDTEWFEVTLQPSDLERIHVFPRAQWRKVARGDFSVMQVISSLRRGHCGAVRQAFLSKISELRESLDQKPDAGVILLIGLDESSPLTILDGNHRFVAACLGAHELTQKFRFFCGLSPNMSRCCWYRTNLATLCRYGLNLLRHAADNPSKDLERIVQTAPSLPPILIRPDYRVGTESPESTGR